METRWIDETIAYDGSQLRAHWILRRLGIEGEALVAFRGPCAVEVGEIADLADLDGPGIAGDDMLHFVHERFDDEPLVTAIWRQRLLTCIAAEAIRDLSGTMPQRDGDDLFVGEGKLTISIATRTPVSSMMHFALNVTDTGAPVSTSSLAGLGIEPRHLAREILARFAAEERSVAVARTKVRAKGEAN